MITTPTFVTTLIVVALLAGVIAWLISKNAKIRARQLQASNQELKQKLLTAEEKTQLLIDDNASIKAQHATARENARMMQLKADELTSQVENLKEELRQLDQLKDSLDRDKASLQAKLDAVTLTREKLEQESKQTFKVIAAELLSHSRKTMNEEGKQSLDQLLNPLREQINGLNKELKEYQQKQDVNTKYFGKELEKMVELSNLLLLLLFLHKTS